MFCSNCGAKLPDDAAFCFKCGRPQRAGGQSQTAAGQSQAARTQPDPDRWEYCEIFVRYKDGLLHDTYFFDAEAVSPRGPYIAMRSAEWKEPPNAPRWQATDSSNERAFAVHKAFISALIKDGWEPTDERGSNWENHRFRRVVRR